MLSTCCDNNNMMHTKKQTHTTTQTIKTHKAKQNYNKNKQTDNAMVTTCFVAVTTAKTLWARWRHTVFILSNGSSYSLQWQILSSSLLWCILVTIQKRQTISATCMRSTDRAWYPEVNPKSCWSQRRLGQTRIQGPSQLSWRLLQSWLRGDSFLPPLHQGGAGIAQSLRILSILYCLLLPLLLFGRGCKGEPVGAKSLKIPSLHLFKYQRQMGKNLKRLKMEKIVFLR